MPELNIRLATPDDAPTIVHHRWAMFVAMGQDEDTVTREVYGVNYEAWLRPKIANGDYIGWLAENERGEVVAGAGLWLHEWHPSLSAPNALAGYVLNVYTQDAYRGRGLAHKLMAVLLDKCRERGIKKVTLHASQYGHPIYESMGFKHTNEMRLDL